MDKKPTHIEVDVVGGKAVLPLAHLFGYDYSAEENRSSPEPVVQVRFRYLLSDSTFHTEICRVPYVYLQSLEERLRSVIEVI